MEILLDTHYLIWYLFNDKKLGKKQREIISDPENSIFYSTASLWEIEIKHKKHPNIIPYTAKEIADACLDTNIENLPIFNKHVYQLDDIRKKETNIEHNDPFDLLLLSQAKRSYMKLMTCDKKFELYDEECILYEKV